VLPDTFRLAASIALVGILWRGPFAYAMYLGMTVTLNDDRRLLRRGVRGTAVVLEGLSADGYEAAESWAGPRTSDPIGHQEA
jgi:hypothetical protein